MAGPEPHIDKKDFDDATLQKRLLAALKGKGERWTVADAVVASGLPKLETERALKVLSREFEGHLDVGESGEIVYRFPGGFVRRGQPTLGDRFAKVGAALYTAFKWFFKVWIMVTMIAYVAIFVALIVAAFVALTASNNNRSSGGRSSSSSGAGAAGGLLNLVARIFFWNAVFSDGRAYGYGYSAGRRSAGWDAAAGSSSRPQPRTKEERAALGKEARPLYRKVFAFVFGDEDRIDPLADDRQILEYVRYLGGRVTASDLALVTGWSVDRADREITRLLADYDGDARVTDEGALLYEFKGLLPSAQSGHGAPMPKFWERADPEYKVSDNASGTNWGIGVANGFNLVMSFLTPSLLFPVLKMDPDVWTFWLSIFPAIFSGLFFLIPFVRAVGVARKNRLRAKRLALRGWYRWIAEHHERLSDEVPVDLRAAAPEAARLAPEAPGDAVASMADEAAAALGGERSDQVVGSWQFGRLIRELAAARAARLAAPKTEREVGAVVFTSETPDTN
ncbi:MAG TPA: hypothetical protein VG389_19215 [Myxococcota bacterium]|jgi:hypothetical protein|nr:hypothetical protein [Myxococcota bacterium]